MLRGKLEEQSELQTRQEEFRDWKREFKAKKAAVLAGKTLTELGNTPTSNESNRGGTFHNNQNQSPHHYQNSRELSTVLESLSKLAELEKRITSLEKDNTYEQLKKAEEPPTFGMKLH